MSRPNDFIMIFVRPATSKSTSKGLPPIEAFIGGTQLSGFGHTVPTAVEDLFTSAGAGKICRKLEKDVEQAIANGGFPDRRAL